MNDNQAKLLLQKYLSGDCNESEKALLESWYLQHNLDLLPDLTEEERKNDLDEVSARLGYKRHQPKLLPLWSKVAAAAMILLTLSVGLYFYSSKDKSKTSIETRQYASDFKPGSNKAVLTLANGRRISLDDAKAGELATQSGILISKTSNGQLIYKVKELASSTNKSVGYNTIQTPRGGQYQIDLPDGTKIWLNAASSLRYPTRFTGNKREVTLSGEAYFEVAKDKTKPFRVISEQQVVEVLGTHFNVNSYNDEKTTKTTLLEGSVKVIATGSKTAKTLFLEPGNQSILSSKDLTKNNVDVEEAVSWKNGQFMFVNESLSSIMRKITRWYDIEVVYKDEVSEKTFSGTVSKYRNVSEVLNMLELTQGVHFEINGNTIIATK